MRILRHVVGLLCGALAVFEVVWFFGPSGDGVDLLVAVLVGSVAILALTDSVSRDERS